MADKSRPSNGALRIGALAAATGLTPDAVRYYERLGLLPPPPRTAGRYRVYPPDTVARLGFIRQAKGFGLELREIRELLTPGAGRGREHCRRVRAVLAHHLDGVEAKLKELESFRRTLRGALGDCDRALERKESIDCPVVDQLRRHQK